MEMSRLANASTSGHEGNCFFSESLPWGWRERAAIIAGDDRDHKLDLGPGILRTAAGDIPSFRAVCEARALLDRNVAKGYLPPCGLPEFRTAAGELILGDTANMADKSLTVQTIGGANALRLAADCLKRLGIIDSVFISAESWADHRRIFERAGLAVCTYPYLSCDSSGIDVDGLFGSAAAMPPRSAILLQASCHNPTGYDPSKEIWDGLFDLIERRGVFPIFDAAYPGLGTCLDADLRPVRECAERGMELMIALSCCKSFSLYDSRVGALTAVTHSPQAAARLESQLKTDIQSNYSSPPRFGADLVARILNTENLRALWLSELSELRESLEQRRRLLTAELEALGSCPSLLKISEQRGLFAWTGLDRTACARLTQEFAVYLPSNGRICLGALPSSRIHYLAQALCAVSRNEELPETNP